MSLSKHVLLPAVAISLVASTAFAEVTRVKCESTNDKYKYCSVPTDNQVRMLEQISEARCDQGKSWGYDKQGVWVDHNCAAEFEVGRSGPSKSQKVAAGAAAGAAILQAMLAAKGPAEAGGAATSHATEAEPAATSASAVPEWLVGTFRATHPKTQEQYYVTVDNRGLLEGRVKDREFFGKVKGEQILVGATTFSYRQDGDGVFVFLPGKESQGVRFAPVE